MRLVILDGYTTNPGDVDWGRLKSLGELTIYEKTLEHEIVERARDADIVITNKTPLSGETLKQLTKCRYVGTLSTGYNVVDLQMADALGIVVSNVPTYCTQAVAQMTFALLLELTNHVALHDQSVHSGDWSSSSQFCYWKSPLVELEHKTMGILGFGNIGQAVARIAQAMGMEVLVHSRTKKELPEGYTWVDETRLFQESDVLSVHCPLTSQTEGFICRKRLSLMKKSAFFINTSRGQVVREADLAEALNTGTIAGAALDVLSQEPPEKDNPLLTAKHCIITPHISWAARESRISLIETVTDNIEHFLMGNPQNVVNHPAK
ncbi:MAG: D-2-hydroxyacid dehydrogenase [Clostridium sp.]